MKTTWILAGLLASGVASAATPNEFVSQWPIAATGEGAYAVVLDDAVYQQTLRRDLADIAAFNADGEALAFGPMPASCAPPPSVWRDARTFWLPATTSQAVSGLQVHVTRSASGELNLDAFIGDAARTDPRVLLVDVLAKDHVVEALQFAFADNTPDISTDIRIEASDDLANWRTIVGSAPIAQLRQNGQVLVRRLVELRSDATPATYLRISRTDGQALPVATVQLLLRPPGAGTQPPERVDITIASSGRDGRAYTYSLPGRFPVERIDVDLASGNTIGDFTISSRDPGERDWRYVGTMTAFALRGAGVELDNEPLMVAATRNREWRVESNVELAAAPTLRVTYRPESWLLLTHGKAPYVIAAGSPKARRDDYPLDALVGQVRAKYGQAWVPAFTALGAQQAAGGDAALKAYNPEEKRTWLLWGVLVLGALAIVVMVLKLMKSPPKVP
jgi:hypothetical protein